MGTAFLGYSIKSNRVRRSFKGPRLKFPSHFVLFFRFGGGNEWAAAPRADDEEAPDGALLFLTSFLSVVLSFYLFLFKKKIT